MKYVKRYNKFNLQTNCRLCLTQSVSTKQPLTSPLKGNQSPRPLVYEALELVTNDKVILSAKYPDTICGMCLELLKISYDLILQYQTSKRELKELLYEQGEQTDTDTDEPADGAAKSDPSEAPSEAPVEIVFGSEKFNIKDLVIVEEENDDTTTFEGFLQNLGKSVSASFVKKGDKKSKLEIEEPSLVIEKIIPYPSDIPSTEASTVQELSMSVDDLVRRTLTVKPYKETPDSIDEDNNHFIDIPASTEAFGKMTKLNEAEKDLFKSALNMKYKCPYCLKPMASLTRVKTHSRNCGKNSVNATCYVCGAKFGLRKQLLSHLKQVHLSEIAASKLRKAVVSSWMSSVKYVCRICGKCFESNGSLSYHMSKHSGRQYSCDKCDKRFYTKTQARCHMQVHSRETVVMCPICGKGFHYQSGLFYHLKMHKNERNLKCTYCPRRFYTRNSLKRHELTHTGARPYACQFCEKKFRSLGEVKKHELLHTGERPYQCRYCDMGFTQTHNMRIHMMTRHSGNYQCTLCPKGFADEEILRFHLKNKHLLDPPVHTETQPSQDTIEDDTENIEGEENTEEGQIFHGVEDIQEEQQAYYITEQFEENEDDEEEINDEDQVDEDSSNLILETYELRDEMLVETVENFM